MFGIVQGGLDKELRQRSAAEICGINFDGYAIGGLSVGEPVPAMWEFVAYTAPLLPETKPRYLMGVGTPSDIVFAVSHGIDMFDCVIPTRSARFGRLWVGPNHINIRNSEFRRDPRPVLEGCDCYCCTNFSRAYLAHLIHAGEVLGIQLATIHNLRFYERLMENLHTSIVENSFTSFSSSFLEGASHRSAGEGVVSIDKD